mmetsp:Transcript_27018/g.85973  ORF Transcript_27018/g.85973 Transcript_27018/m.85973 type:complete len:539 (+) Transcript_27018:34-1650(+)
MGLGWCRPEPGGSRCPFTHFSRTGALCARGPRRACRSQDRSPWRHVCHVRGRRATVPTPEWSPPPVLPLTRSHATHCSWALCSVTGTSRGVARVQHDQAVSCHRQHAVASQRQGVDFGHVNEQLPAQRSHKRASAACRRAICAARQSARVRLGRSGLGCSCDGTRAGEPRMPEPHALVDARCPHRVAVRVDATHCRATAILNHKGRADQLSRRPVEQQKPHALVVPARGYQHSCRAAERRPSANGANGVDAVLVHAGAAQQLRPPRRIAGRQPPRLHMAARPAEHRDRAACLELDHVERPDRPARLAAWQPRSLHQLCVGGKARIQPVASPALPVPRAKLVRDELPGRSANHDAVAAERAGLAGADERCVHPQDAARVVLAARDRLAQEAHLRRAVCLGPGGHQPAPHRALRAGRHQHALRRTGTWDRRHARAAHRQRPCLAGDHLEGLPRVRREGALAAGYADGQRLERQAGRRGRRGWRGGGRPRRTRQLEGAILAAGHHQVAEVACWQPAHRPDRPGVEVGAERGPGEDACLVGR